MPLVTAAQVGCAQMRGGRRCGPGRRVGQAGITVIEVLMALFLISIIATLMLPAIATTWKKSRTNRSMSNLQQIGVLVADYQNNNGGRGARRTNGGRGGYTANPDNYYWGAMYEIDKRVFHSPHSWATSAYEVDGPRSDGHIYTDYGFNGVGAFWLDEVANFEVSSTHMARELSTYANPALTIVAQDHFESMIDGNGDVPCYEFAEDPNILNQGHQGFNPNKATANNSETMLLEIFRNQNFCCILWADGHVSQIPITGVWDPRWYTGGFKAAQEGWEKRENGRFVKPAPYSYGNAFTGRF